MSPFSQDVTIFCHPHTESSHQSHTLLRQAASLYSGRSEAELGSLETTKWGKPFFSSQPDLHFSITHSGDWWLCGFSSCPLGLDLQIHRSHVSPDKLSRRFFHPLEDAFLEQNNYTQFFDLWCAKESWVKYTGHGFYNAPESFSVVSFDGPFPCVDGAELRLIPFEPGYSLCLCAHRLGAYQIRMF